MVMRRILPPFNVALIPTYTYTFTGGVAAGEQTIGGIVYSKKTASTRRRMVQLDVSVSPATALSIRYESPSPNVTVSESGLISGDDGAGAIVRCFVDKIGMQYFFESEVLASQEQLTFDRFATNVLAGAIWQQTNDSIAADEFELYSVRDHAKKQYVRNPNFWLGLEVDVSCWPVWNSRYGSRFNGCLITKRHLLLAKHACPKVGDTIRFASRNGVITERTLTASMNTDPLISVFGATDFMFGELDAPVPVGINPCKVLPSTISAKMAKVGLPLIVGNQNYQIGMRKTPAAANERPSDITHFANDIGALAEFSIDIVSGDSGSPVWLLVGNELVLVGTHFTAHRSSYLPHTGVYLDPMIGSMSGATETTVSIDVSSYPNV